MRTAIGYTRVSSPGQVEGVSLELQIDRIKDKAAMHDWELANIHTDKGISARQMARRKGLDAALQEACESQGVLVFYNFDRLCRNVPDGFAILEQLTAAGASMLLSTAINSVCRSIVCSSVAPFSANSSNNAGTAAGSRT